MELQINLDEYKFIDKQIERSKIKRYPYKEYLGISLTSLIFDCFKYGVDIHTTMGIILQDTRIKLMLINFPTEKENILKNIWISVCARHTEYKRFNK